MYLIVGSAFLALVLALAHSQCSVNLQNDLASLEPLFIKNDELWAPSGPNLTWKSRETTIVACSKVSLFNASSNTASLTCVSGRDFLLDGLPMKSSELRCSGRMTGDVIDTEQRCGVNGTLKKIGFDVKNVGFVTYIETCFNNVSASVIYSKHVIPGSAIDYAIKESYRPAFKVAGASSQVSPANSYTQEAQLSRLSALLGSLEQAKKFIRGGSYYLARGHLAPDADGIFRPWQWATFFYVNAAPQWQIINAGNWLVVENLARAKAAALGEDVVVFSGANDILRLPSTTGEQVAITLEQGGIQTPKWFWKIIISNRTDSGIAFVTHNDPFRGSMPSSEMLCQDICQQYGWGDDRFNNFERGYTYCCTVDDLKTAVADIPRNVSVRSVLRK